MYKLTPLTHASVIVSSRVCVTPPRTTKLRPNHLEHHDDRRISCTRLLRATRTLSKGQCHYKCSIIMDCATAMHWPVSRGVFLSTGLKMARYALSDKGSVHE
jgi:hypothetical protein